MRKEIEKIVKGDLEEARVSELCDMIKKELEWLRRRLHGHSFDGDNVGLGYVDARIDDMEIYL